MSEQHFHSPDSPCLERVREIPTMKFAEGERVMVPAENWWRCAYLADLERTTAWRGEYPVHIHGTAFVAHEFLNACGFPA